MKKSIIHFRPTLRYSGEGKQDYQLSDILGRGFPHSLPLVPVDSRLDGVVCHRKLVSITPERVGWAIMRIYLRTLIVVVVLGSVNILPPTFFLTVMFKGEKGEKGVQGKRSSRLLDQV